MGYFKSTMYYGRNTPWHYSGCNCAECQAERKIAPAVTVQTTATKTCNTCHAESPSGWLWASGFCDECKPKNDQA